MTMTRRTLSASALALFMAAEPLGTALADPLAIPMTGQHRDAYRGYNAGIVQAILSVRR